MEYDALLAVTTLLATVVFDDEALFAIFGGTKKIIESPVLDRILAQRERQMTQKHIIANLKARFESVPTDLADRIRTIENEAQLDDLHHFAVICPDLEAFRVRLSAGA